MQDSSAVTAPNTTDARSPSSSPTKAPRRWSTPAATTETESNDTSPNTSPTPTSKPSPAHSKRSAPTHDHSAPAASAAKACCERSECTSRLEPTSLRAGPTTIDLKGAQTRFRLQIRHLSNEDWVLRTPHVCL